jgi:hypothetical protein
VSLQGQLERTKHGELDGRRLELERLDAGHVAGHEVLRVAAAGGICIMQLHAIAAGRGEEAARRLAVTPGIMTAYRNPGARMEVGERRSVAGARAGRGRSG